MLHRNTWKLRFPIVTSGFVWLPFCDVCWLLQVPEGHHAGNSQFLRFVIFLEGEKDTGHPTKNIDL